MRKPTRKEQFRPQRVRATPGVLLRVMRVAHHHTVGRLWCWRDAKKTMAGGFQKVSKHGYFTQIDGGYHQPISLKREIYWLFDSCNLAPQASWKSKAATIPSGWGSELQRWQGAWRPNLCIQSKVCIELEAGRGENRTTAISHLCELQYPWSILVEDVEWQRLNVTQCDLYTSATYCISQVAWWMSLCQTAESYRKL